MNITSMGKCTVMFTYNTHTHTHVQHNYMFLPKERNSISVTHATCHTYKLVVTNLLLSIKSTLPNTTTKYLDNSFLFPTPQTEYIHISSAMAEPNQHPFTDLTQLYEGQSTNCGACREDHFAKHFGLAKHNLKTCTAVVSYTAELGKNKQPKQNKQQNFTERYKYMYATCTLQVHIQMLYVYTLYMQQKFCGCALTAKETDSQNIMHIRDLNVHVRTPVVSVS